MTRTIRLINKMFNPLILWCFGWKRKIDPDAHPVDRIKWRNPKTGHWEVEGMAISLCEHRGTDDS